MITVAKVKQLVGDERLSDDEAEKIRDACYCMAELLVEAWENSTGEERIETTKERDPGRA